ncbi:hypothetical protein CBS147352_11031 [Aspergillus niger]|nr:hypothetical protein CBS147324_10944 [Aspergillus niger]KAI3037377.1 hypothetical protein CBS147352_11031 [Aspergillus niger]
MMSLRICSRATTRRFAWSTPGSGPFGWLRIPATGVDGGFGTGPVCGEGLCGTRRSSERVSETHALRARTDRIATLGVTDARCFYIRTRSTIPGVRNVARRRETIFRKCHELSKFGVGVWVVICTGARDTMFKSSNTALFEQLDREMVYTGLPPASLEVQ